MPIARKLTRDDLDYICDLLNLDGDSVRTEYSGRGMYGRTCIGFDVEPSEVVAVGAALAAALARTVDADDIYDLRDEIDDALYDGIELARRACVDSMGLGAIVYFPGVTLAEATEETTEPATAG